MAIPGCYWLYNRELPAPGWHDRLIAWLSRHGGIPTAIWVRIGDDRDEIVRAMYDDCVEHGFSARAFVDMAEGGLQRPVQVSSLDEALVAVADATRWNLSFFGGFDLARKIVAHMSELRPRNDDLIPCNLSIDGGLRPISCYKSDDVVLDDLCRFRIGLCGEGTTVDAPLLLKNLKSTPGFAEWKADAEECFGPLHEYLFHYGL